MADGGYSSGTWGQAGWGCSVYDRATPELANAAVTVNADQLTLRIVSETVASIDKVFAAVTLVGVVSENTAGNDSVSTLFTVNGRVQETAQAVAVVSSLANVNSQVAESIRTNDAVSLLRNTFVVLNETATSNDAVATQVAYNSTAEETAVAQEQLNCAFGFSGKIIESANVSDTTLVFNSISVSVSDHAAATLFVSSLANFAARIVEVGAAEDKENAKGVFNSRVTDTAFAFDTGACRFLWEVINTGNVGTWSVIGTGNTSVWSAINTANVDTWSLINTGNTTAWATIDTSNTATWAVINTV